MGTAPLVDVARLDAEADGQLLAVLDVVEKNVAPAWQGAVAEAALYYVSTVDEWRPWHDTAKALPGYGDIGGQAVGFFGGQGAQAADAGLNFVENQRNPQLTAEAFDSLEVMFGRRDHPGRSAPAQRPAEKPRLHYVAVDPQGGLLLNRQPVKLAELPKLFAALKQAETDPSVVVRGADDVDYRHIVGVIDLLQQADITKVGLATGVAK